MSTYLGTTLLAGVATDTISNANSLLDFKWTDHILNELNWLRADTFSWQSGAVYVAAYNHLVADSSGTAQTETIGSYTITYYRANDGHKIVLADQEQTVTNIYNECGVSWYYILDTTNTRFKLPRTKFGFTGIRDGVGNFVGAGLPNITGLFNFNNPFCNGSTASGAFASSSQIIRTHGDGGGSSGGGFTFDASRSSSIYGNSTTVQPPATQMYLYFYVGNFSQSATEQTAGLNSELFNGKMDLDLGNVTQTAKEAIVGWGMPDYSAVITVSYPYTAICDGIANVYGASSGSDTVTVNGAGIGSVFSGTNGVTVLLNKGDILNVTGSEVAYIYFIPLKGVNNA